MLKPLKQNYLKLFLIISFILASVYILYRSANLSFTHDESFTYIWFVNNASLKDIVLYKDPILNNHILNSLAMKFIHMFFGDSELLLRLQSYFGFVLYFTSGIIIFRKFKSKVFFLTGMVIYIFNIYLFDYFSLARGYALGVGLVSIAVALSIEYILSNKRSVLVWIALITSAAAVYANFSFNHLHIAINLLSLLFVFKDEMKVFNITNYKRYLKKLIPFSVVNLILSILIIIPILKLKQTGQISFGGSGGIINETIRSLVSSTIYINSNDNLIWGITYSILVIFLLAPIVYFILDKKNKVTIVSKIMLVTWIVIAFTFASNIIQNLILHDGYSIGRSALFMIPLLVILGLSLLGSLRSFNVKIDILCRVGLVGISLMFLTHFMINSSVYSVKDWNYDANSKKAFELIEKDARGSFVNVETSWIFFQSFDFYVTQKNIKNIHIRTIDPNRKDQIVADYYYFPDNNSFINSDEIIFNNTLLNNTENEPLAIYKDTHSYLLKHNK